MENDVKAKIYKKKFDDINKKYKDNISEIKK